MCSRIGVYCRWWCSMSSYDERYASLYVISAYCVISVNIRPVTSCLHARFVDVVAYDITKQIDFASGIASRNRCVSRVTSRNRYSFRHVLRHKSDTYYVLRHVLHHETDTFYVRYCVTKQVRISVMFTFALRDGINIYCLRLCLAQVNWLWSVAIHTYLLQFVWHYLAWHICKQTSENIIRQSGRSCSLVFRSGFTV